MTTTAEIIEVFREEIFADPSILEITDKAFDYGDVADDIASGSEAANLRYQQQINFFTFTGFRELQTGTIRGTNTVASRYRHTIEIFYYLEKGEDPGESYNKAIAAIETIDDLIRLKLGKSWDDTVDFYEFAGIQRLTLIDTDERKVRRIGHTYVGTKQI